MQNASWGTTFQNAEGKNSRKKKPLNINHGVPLQHLTARPRSNGHRFYLSNMNNSTHRLKKNLEKDWLSTQLLGFHTCTKRRRKMTSLKITMSWAKVFYTQSPSAARTSRRRGRNPAHTASISAWVICYHASFAAATSSSSVVGCTHLLARSGLATCAQPWNSRGSIWSTVARLRAN